MSNPSPSEAHTQYLAIVAEAEKAWVQGTPYQALGILQDLKTNNPTPLPPALALEGQIICKVGNPALGVPMVQAAIEEAKRVQAENPEVSLMPSMVAFMSNLGGALRDLNDFDGAVQVTMEAVEIAQRCNLANLSDCLLNLGLALADIGQNDAAKAALMRCLGLKPESVDGHMGMAQSLLSDGDAWGWEEYEWKIKTVGFSTPPAELHTPTWNGMVLPLNPQTGCRGDLVVLADQGFGDFFMFSRWLPLLRWSGRVGRVILGCDKSLVSFAQEHQAELGLDAVFSEWKDCPPHQAIVTLSSLPRLFPVTNTPNTLPYSPYHADLGLFRTNPARVGFCLTGRPTHPYQMRRCIDPALFEDEVRRWFPQLHWVDLTKPATGLTAEVPELADWLETARMVVGLDLVITIDTAIAHLCGSLGVPCMVLVSSPCEWRWADKWTTHVSSVTSPWEHSLWYPDELRLIRQVQPGDWRSCLEVVCDELDRLTETDNAHE
jgi:tetratricopeptide (TPR) repeat protein